MDEARITSAEELCMVVSAKFAPLSFADRCAQFNGLLATRDMGDGVSLIDVRSSRVDHTPQMHLKAQETTRELVFFATHTVGHGRMLQHGRVAAFGPGDGVLYESE